jgi:arabinosaccharide transport system substrate-binding protein
MKYLGVIVLFLLSLFLSMCCTTRCREVSEEKRKVVMWIFTMSNIEWDIRINDIETKFDIEFDIQRVRRDDFVQKLREVILNGEGAPDIIEWMIEDHDHLLNSDPGKCLVLPLNQFTDESEVFKKVIPGRVAWITYGGNIYGLPHDAHPVVLIYNDTLWKEAGVDVAGIVTWEEFFEKAKLLTAEKQEGKSLHYALPSGNSGLCDTMFMIWQQTGAQILDQNGHPILTCPEFTAFLKKWLEWNETGAFTMWDWGNFAILLMNGTLCSYLSPDWWVSQVNYAAEEGIYEWRVRDLPAYDEGGANTASWGGSFLAIPKGTENPEFIYKMIEYMQYEINKLSGQYECCGMIPPLAGVWEDELFNKPDTRFDGQILGELQFECAKNIPSMNLGDLFWDAITIFNQYYSEMVTGKMSAEEGLNKAQADIEARM